MWFWWFILVCDLIVPVMMVISGRMMWKRPPKTSTDSLDTGQHAL